MKIKTDHGSFEARDLTFKDRRKLHRMEVAAVNIQTGEMNSDKFYDLLEWIMNFCYLKAEDIFADLDDTQIDEVLIATYNQYKAGVSKKKS